MRTADEPASEEVKDQRRVSFRTGLVVFVLFWVAFGSWAMATPIFAPPDEHTHAIRATSVARGQIIGRKTTKAWTKVEAPALYTDYGFRVNCWNFKPELTPTCMGPFEGSLDLVTSDTYVGRYNPVYYGIVGLPSLVTRGAAGVHLMRLTSAALSAALITLAALAALRARRPSLALTGLAFALTPMTLFLAGSINPNGMEVTAAICLWVAGLLALDPRYRTTSLIVATAIGASFLVVSRGLAPVWLALILGLQALAVVREPRRSLLRDRRVVKAGVAVGVVTLGALAWSRLTDALAVLPVGAKLDGPLPNLAQTILGNTRIHLEEMVGVLQYLDTRAPFFTYLVWFVGIGALGILALVVGSTRARLALLLCTGLALLTPLLELPTVREAGLIWQGRYGLPLAVGIPILAAHALSGANQQVLAVVRRLGMILVVAAGFAVVAAFYWAGRRNAVGVGGPLLWFGREDWHSPLPGWFLTLTFTAAVGALVGLFLKLARAEEQTSASDFSASTAIGSSV